MRLVTGVPQHHPLLVSPGQPGVAFLLLSQRITLWGVPKPRQPLRCGTALQCCPAMLAAASAASTAQPPAAAQGQPRPCREATGSAHPPGTTLQGLQCTPTPWGGPASTLTSPTRDGAPPLAPELSLCSPAGTLPPCPHGGTAWYPVGAGLPPPVATPQLGTPLLCQQEPSGSPGPDVLVSRCASTQVWWHLNVPVPMHPLAQMCWHPAAPVPVHPGAQMCWHPDMLVSSCASPHPPRCARMCWTLPCPCPGPAAPLSPPTLGDGLSCAGAFIHRDADSVCPTSCPLPPWHPRRWDPAPQNWGGAPWGGTIQRHGGSSGCYCSQHTAPSSAWHRQGCEDPQTWGRLGSWWLLLRSIGKSAAGRMRREQEEDAGEMGAGGTPAPEGICGRAKFLSTAAKEELSCACSHQ
ncbi:vegetative cell wall protein gp1-like [Aquila chrysaetos chrysaetos]|uniref:vegetative cell wall protein gp1-like n=1 Tax=Aquila chrysaetos chrysaetos TaxID=223781 RepID=UPI0011771176|nr:vegetative cell wall protein gp1-like [Aquila chrysaetos chrysaetos]